MRAAVALGLAIALIVVPGMPPGAAPAIAQDEAPETEPASPPSTEQSGEPKPSGPSQPSGPAPAFSPSGPGSGSGTGSGSGAPAPKPAGQPAGPSAPSGSSAPSAASGSSLPALGAVTYENALQDEKVFKAGHCFGQNAKGHYVGEGFRLSATGRCPLILEESTISVWANGVTIGDGEVAIDFKVVEGSSRARVGLYVRNVNEELIGGQVQPARGEASLLTIKGIQQTDLGYRNNLVVPQNEWNRLAVRVYGYNVWLLINDEPVLHSNEVYADAGRVIIEMVRDGDLDDGAEVAVVFRNLTLTALEGGDPERAPRGP
jgi:hypothetical protein